MNAHHTDSELISLSLGCLRTSESLRVQQHVMDCPRCLHRLIDIETAAECLEAIAGHALLIDKRKPLYVVHDTADGMILSRTEKRGRAWFARHWGDQLDGGRECKTMLEANEFLRLSFQ